MEKQGILNDKSIVGSPMGHMAWLFIALFIFWLGLSGTIEPKIIFYGVIASAITARVTYPLLLIENRDKTRKYFIFDVSQYKFILYAFWLLWQLILANVHVMKTICDADLPINPRIVRFYFRTDNPVAEVLLANSITLTPGTVTVNVEDDGLFEIHALTSFTAEGVLDGSMQAKIADLFGEKLDFEPLPEKEEE